jgi:hypothetical protein
MGPPAGPPGRAWRLSYVAQSVCFGNPQRGPPLCNNLTGTMVEDPIAL